MRRFWLKKGADVWDLSADNFGAGASFMAEPQGLGVKVKVDSFEVERAVFIESVKMQSVEIGGKLYFKDYAQFAEFAAFIGYVETTEPLRLYYSTAASKPDYASAAEWYKLVLVQEIKKGEIDVRTGLLICEVKFAALSRWRQDNAVVIEVERYGDALVYPYRYAYRYGGMNHYSVEIDNGGNLPTHCTVKIEGETRSPDFRIVQNNETLERARYNIDIPVGGYLIVNGDPAEQEASLYTVNGGAVTRRDVYDKGELDYAYSNFITIPSGVCTFVIDAQNSYFGKTTLRYSRQREVI